MFKEPIGVKFLPVYSSILFVIVTFLWFNRKTQDSN
ncbi:DUF5957 family protein [Ureibacillus acetophenoni]